MKGRALSSIGGRAGRIEGCDKRNQTLQTRTLRYVAPLALRNYSGCCLFTLLHSIP